MNGKGIARSDLVLGGATVGMESGTSLVDLQGLRSPRLTLPIKNQLPFVLRDDDGIVGVVPCPFDPVQSICVVSSVAVDLASLGPKTVKLELAATLLTPAAVAATG